LIFLSVGPIVLRRLKLLNSLPEINLSPEETLALMRRLETDSCRPEDCEGLIRIVRAHTNLSTDFLEASPGVEPSSPALKAKRQRQGARRPRR
jgi:hypothetical protein